MTKPLCITSMSIALFLGLSLGCATTGPALSDEELVHQQVEKWAQGLVEHDMEMFLSTISESFSTAQAADKQTLADFITMAIDSGYVDEAEISLEDAQFNIADNVCSVYPIDLMSAAGAVSVELILSKENGDWLVTGMEIDGI